MWMMDTQNYLPQHRRRLYAIGVNKSVGCTTPCTPPLPMAFQRISLADLMHPGIPPMQEHCLPIRLLQHLTVAKGKFLAGIQSGQIMATNGGGWWMAVELDRNPQKTWAVPMRFDGYIPTLRTQHEQTWVMHTPILKCPDFCIP